MTPTDAEQSLTGLGMSRQEAETYLATLKLGEASASTIAKEMRCKRTTVYPILKKLAERGFVTLYVRKSRQVYRAQKPNMLAHIFANKLQTFTNIIPSLELLEKQTLQASGLRFMETKSELEIFYKDIIEEYRGKTYQSIGDVRGWEGVDPEFFVWYRKARAHARIKTQLVLSHESRAVNPTDPTLLREVRYFPEGMAFRSSVDIFKDKILIVSTDIQSLAVVIAVPAMVDIFNSIFSFLWERAEKE